MSVIKTYLTPFDKTRHDALDRKDFFMGQFDANGRIVPVSSTL